MGVDVAGLLAPVSEESPAGEDLSYDAGRTELDLAFENSFSADGGGDDETDWRDVVRQIVEQSARTKDVWLAVYLCRAGAKLSDLETVSAGAQYLAGLFEEYWPVLHPQLEEYGFQGRKGPCESLTRVGEFLRPLRQTLLLRHARLGEFSGEDIERFATGGSAEDGYGMFRAALADLGVEALQESLDHLDRLRDGIRRADAVLTANAEGDTATNFAPTYEVIEALRRAVSAFAGPADDAAEAGDAGGEPGEDASRGAGGPGFSAGRIETREDVARAIDAIIDYYRRREPGSPMPVLLTRARDWINADFLTLISDIAPNGLDDVMRVLTSQRSEE